MLKKLLTYTLVVTTMVWSVGLLATPLAVGAVSSGDLIKLQCSAGASVSDPCKSVYYLGADGKRYTFPNAKTYNTWYSDFSNVKIVSGTELSSYQLAGNVTYKPGVKLVKITTDPKVYAVGANGSLMWVTTAAIAEAIYGANWAQMVEDVPDAFFTNYSTPANSDITNASDYDRAAQTAAAVSINDDKNLAGGGSGTTVPTGTGLTISLASDTPASGLLVGNSIHNPFTKVNFTASADGDAVIDQIVVRRGGTVASDAAFSGIVLLDATTMQRTETPKTLNSLHKATFNKNLTIPAGSTKSYYIAGNMNGLGSYSGEIPTLDLFDVKMVGSTAIVGSLPITGNHQNLNGTITIGTLTVANGSANPDASTQKVGQNDYTVSSVKLTANSTENFSVKSITFDQGGTASDSDVANIDLLVDDSVVATLSGPQSDKVVFDLVPAIMIEKGKNKEFALRADLVDGSARTIRFDLEDESDIVAVGQTYGAKVKVSAGTGATADADPFWTAPVTTIDSGSLRVSPATLSSADIANDSDQVILGKFELEANGEPIIISRFPVQFQITTSSGSTVGNVTHADLTAITVYDEDGNVVAGGTDTAGITYTDGSRVSNVGATSTDTFTIKSGTHIYTVKGDVGADFEADDIIVARLNPGQITAKGEVTGVTVTPTPSAEQSSATMTVKTASLSVSLSSTPSATTVVAGSQNLTFANLILDANSGEDIRVTRVKVAVVTTTMAPNQLSNWRIWDGSTELSTSNSPASNVATAGGATTTFTFTSPLIIPKATVKTLSIKGSISNSVTSGTVRVGVPEAEATGDYIAAKGNASGSDATVSLSTSDGPTFTVQSTGTLTISKDGSTPKASLIPSDTDGVTLAVLNAFARYENINIEKIYVTASQVNSGGFDQIDQLYLYNGSTLLKSITPTATDAANKTALFDLTGKPLTVTKDSSSLITIKADTESSDYELGSNGASGQGLSVKINAVGDVTAKGALSGDTLAAGDKTLSNAAGNSMYLFRTIPVITPNDQLSGGIASGSLNSGTTANVELYKFKVSADGLTSGGGGKIGIQNVGFVISTSTATITDIFLYEGGVKIGTASTSPALHVTDNADGDTMIYVTHLTTDGAVEASNNLLPQEAVINAGSSRTYTLKGTIQCSSGCSGSDGSGSVIVQFLGDGSVLSTLPATASVASVADLYGERNFQWTDFWRTSILNRSSTTATITEQWSNGYLVKDSASNDLAATSTAVSFSR